MRPLSLPRIALALGLAAALGACGQDNKPTSVGDDAGETPEVDASTDEPTPGEDASVDESDGSVDGGTPAPSLEESLLGADLVAPDPGKLEQDLMLPDEAFLPADLLPPG
jgi:hypothetical protein